MDVDDDDDEYSGSDESVSSESDDNYIKPDSNFLPIIYVKKIADNFKEFKRETNEQRRKEYSKKNIKYITNYMYNMLWKLDFQQILKVTMDVCFASLEKDEFGLENLLFFKFLEFLEQGLYYVYNLYSLKEIQIDETDILCGESECADVTYDIETIRQCLEKTDIHLFVSIDKSSFFCYSYKGICYDREKFGKLILEGSINYSSFEDNRMIYIKLPIASPGRNIYIPLLSAIIISKTKDKRIFYLLKQDVSRYYGFDETVKPKYCVNDESTPIMYVAICGGRNCSKEEWTGGCVDHMEIYRTKLAKYMQEKKHNEEVSKKRKI